MRDGGEICAREIHAPDIRGDRQPGGKDLDVFEGGRVLARRVNPSVES